MTSQKKRPGTALTHQQFQHLNERINAVRVWRQRADCIEPNHIKSIRKTLKRFDDAVEKKNDKIQRRCASDKLAVKEAINFSDPETALKAVVAFEKKWGGK